MLTIFNTSIHENVTAMTVGYNLPCLTVSVTAEPGISAVVFPVTCFHTDREEVVCLKSVKLRPCTVKHLKMMDCLSEIGMDDKDLQIITKLYWEQSASVRTESGMKSEFKIKKGVRQGCVLSPNLFNLYTEKIFREVEDMKGVNIGGVNINNLRYADDTVLLEEGPMFLQALLTAVNEKGKPYGMEMNIIKTKSMVISRKKPVPNISISVEGKPIQQVERMVYLGYMATEDGKCDKEIKRRIGIARTAFESMATILTSRNISIELRSRIAKCYIWSTLLYGAETWTLTKVTSDKLEASEMWLYRRMLRISW